MYFTDEEDGLYRFSTLNVCKKIVDRYNKFDTWIHKKKYFNSWDNFYWMISIQNCI